MVIAEVGKSDERVKTITVPTTFPGCPARVDKSNWLGYEDAGYEDYFFIKRSQDLTELTITRGDAQGVALVWRHFVYTFSNGSTGSNIFSFFFFDSPPPHPPNACKIVHILFMLTSVYGYQYFQTWLVKRITIFQMF